MILGPPRLQDGDDFQGCPHCGSTLPNRKTAPRFNHVKRGKQYLSIETGAEYLCAHCGEVYSVGPSGVIQVKFLVPKVAMPAPVDKSEYKQPSDHRPLQAKERP